MRGNAGVLIVVVGLIVLYVALSEKYVCFTECFDCLLNRRTIGGTQPATTPTTPTGPVPSHGPLGGRLSQLGTQIGNIGGGLIPGDLSRYRTPPFIPLSRG